MTKRDKLVEKQIANHNFDNKPECHTRELKFYELEITIRAGSIDEINGLLPRVTGDFMLKQGKQKIGSKAEDSFNFVWHLTDEHERGKQ